MRNHNGKAQQLLASLTVNLLTMSTGIAGGWPSPVIPQLRSNNPPVGNVPMSENHTSWITNLFPIGGLLIVPFCGMITERIGRRNFAFLTGLPYIGSWILIIFALDHTYLIAARFLTGIASGMATFIVPIYVGEIASDEIRGTLGYLFSLSMNIGILFSYVAGAFLSYRSFATLALGFPVLLVSTIFFLPDTPAYLVRKNSQAGARKSLMFFRNKNDPLVDKELTKLQRQLEVSGDSSKISFRYLFSDLATRRGLIISIGLIAAQQLSGIFAVTSYAETIFRIAGCSIPSETAPIIIGVILIIGDYISTTLIDRIGRRPLSLISYIGMAMGHGLLAGFFFLQQYKYDVSSISWLPLVALSIFVITHAIGASGLPFVVISEIFRLDVTSFATTICCTLCFTTTLTSIKIFDLTMHHLKADGCFFVLASFCTAGLVFTYCMLPETKGRSREDIVNELARPKQVKRLAGVQPVPGMDANLLRVTQII